ncbi:DNA repair REX1-B-domain-containing protein [Tribonema minus]|uniref:DNA repair REX1-B-domain-containing protein n=1 Tax=Tribonema minus TaxID=303371 RepID=A0A835Z786_9STRA|nr:DNA repair REX1-B-domain-containing protein [Tribonema minus]
MSPPVTAPTQDNQQCLSILSQRTPHAHSIECNTAEGSCHGHGEHIRKGQVIDLAASTPAAPAPSSGGGNNAAANASSVAQATLAQTTNGEQLSAQLSTMSASEVIGAFQAAQEERVRTYSRFNYCLDDMLSQQQQGNASGGCAAYPALCAEMTATFAALSGGIRLMKAALEQKGEAGAAGIVGRIQTLEEQKLTTTAALHLEKMRRGTVLWGERDGPSSQLLHAGVRELEGKVAALAASVSEALEDLRYELE